jgi:hypothetical protein
MSKRSKTADKVVSDEDAFSDFEQINIRLSPENAKFLREEARRTGNTMIGLASLAVSDWLQHRRVNYKQFENIIYKPAMRDEKKKVERYCQVGKAIGLIRITSCHIFRSRPT